MIQIRVDGKFYVPVVNCDLCGGAIDDAGAALVGHDHPASPRQPVGIKFAHKACDLPPARRSGELWMPLDAFLVYVSRSVGVQWGSKSAAQAADRFGSL